MAIKYRAFTLTEVLITLGVIGIVAAMTLPTVVNKYKKKETVTRLKKAYSVINQAIIRSEADNGAMRYWFISNPVEQQEDSVMYGKIALDYIVPYMSGTRIKYSYYSDLDAYGKTVVNMGGIEMGGAPASRYYAITGDGMYISAGHVNWVYIVPFFQVDINGRKGPNVFGKDIFYFMISNKNKLAGYNYYGYNREQILENSCNKTSSGRNEACTALIMMDGWEIKDDYPW